MTVKHNSFIAKTTHFSTIMVHVSAITVIIRQPSSRQQWPKYVAFKKTEMNVLQ
jgi:hypothetical protein